MVKNSKSFLKKNKSHSALWEGIRRFLKNKLAVVSLVVLLVIILSCVFAPALTDKDWAAIDIGNRYSGITSENILGTDVYGRDNFTRLLYGGRYTFKVAFCSLLLSALGGTVVGLCAGFFGGRADNIIMRLVDAVSAVPTVLLVVVVECGFNGGKGNYMYAMAISFLPPFTKVIRAAVMNIMESEYIEAARALGVGRVRIILKHVLHNITSPLIIQLSNTAADAFLTCTIMGYIGFSFTPPTPEWGMMVATGLKYIRTRPLTGLLPSLVIVVCAMALNLIGNGLRDAFDTREKVL